MIRELCSTKKIKPRFVLRSEHLDVNSLVWLCSWLQGAKVQAIKKQYHLLSLKYHPDKGGDDVMFMRIAKAYAA